MKTKLPLISLILACGALLGAAFGPQHIRWVFQDSPVFRRRNIQFNGYVEFGLRDDGVVVWREITTTTNTVVVTTNSPAEVLDQQQQGIYYWTNSVPPWATNIVLTNWIRPL